MAPYASTRSSGAWGSPTKEGANANANSNSNNKDSDDEGSPFQYAYSSVGSSTESGSTPGRRSGSEEFHYVSSSASTQSLLSLETQAAPSENGTTTFESVGRASAYAPANLTKASLESSNDARGHHAAPSTSSTPAPAPAPPRPVAQERYSMWADEGYNPNILPIKAVGPRPVPTVPTPQTQSIDIKGAATRASTSKAIPVIAPPSKVPALSHISSPSGSLSISSKAAPRSLAALFQARVEAAKIGPVAKPSAEGVVQDGKGWYDTPSKTLIASHEDIKKLQEEIKVLTGKRDALVRERDEAEQQVAEALRQEYSQVEKLRKQIDEHVQKMDEMDMANEEAQDKLRQELASEKVQARELLGKVKPLEEALEDAEAQLAALKAKLAGTEKKLSTTEEKLSNTEARLSALDSKLVDTTKKLEEAIDEVVRCEDSARPDPDTALLNEIAELTARLETELTTVNKLQGIELKAKKLETDAFLLRDDKVELTEKLRKIEDGRDAFRDRLVSLEASSQKVEHGLQMELKTLSDEKQQLQKKLQQYEDVNNSTTRGLQSVQEALQQSEDGRHRLEEDLEEARASSAKLQGAKPIHRYTRQELIDLADAQFAMKSPGLPSGRTPGEFNLVVQALTDELSAAKISNKDLMEKLNDMMRTHEKDVIKAETGDTLAQQLLSALVDIESQRDELLIELGRPIPEPQEVTDADALETMESKAGLVTLFPSRDDSEKWSMDAHSGATSTQVPTGPPTPHSPTPPMSHWEAPSFSDTLGVPDSYVPASSISQSGDSDAPSTDASVHTPRTSTSTRSASFLERFASKSETAQQSLPSSTAELKSEGNSVRSWISGCESK